MPIHFAGLTDVGMRRDHNEDSFAANPETNLYIVCDGMGGHAAGEVASRIAVDTVASFIQATANDEDITWPFEYDESLSLNANRMRNLIKAVHQAGFEVSHVSLSSYAAALVSVAFLSGYPFTLWRVPSGV